MKLYLAKQEDIDLIVSWMNQAKKHLKEQNIPQWQTNYPNQMDIEKDIMKKVGYIVEEKNQKVGYLCLDFEEDLAYRTIVGQWLTQHPYAVIHRMTLNDEARGHGLASQVFEQAFEICQSHQIDSVRIDTHEANLKMQHVCLKSGFVYCGKVMQNDGERLAFERVLKK